MKRPLAALNSLVQSNDSRLPQANVTNAPYLMGDPWEGGDIDGVFGDPGESGPYGDIETAALNTYNSLIGDAEEVGALSFPHLGPTGKKIAIGLGAAGATTAGILELRHLLQKRAAKRSAVAQNLLANSRRSTISNQVQARRLMGGIPRTAAMPFYQISGATLNAYPLAPTEVFAADTLKYNFDRQSTDTPFEVEIVQGVFAGVTWTLTAVGVVATRFYTAVIITIGISVLTAAPGTIFSVAGTFPTFNGGSLVIAANPFSFTIRKGYDCRFIIFPWQLVTNKPLLALGAYNTVTNIVVTVTGLPSNAAVSMIVPGSQHVWTIGMRNRLLI